MNMINRLPADSFLVSHLRGEIECHVSFDDGRRADDVSTALYPNQHGVSGWFTYLPHRQLTMTVLPFAERLTNQPLTARGIRPEDVLPPCVMPKMTHRALSLVPTYIANTPYNVYSRGGTSGQGYEKITDGIDHVIAAVITAKTPTYVHLYLHDVDTLCHHVGVNHDTVVPLVLGIDAELAAAGGGDRGRARIVISADHGLIDVPKPDQSLLFVGDELWKCCCPACRRAAMRGCRCFICARGSGEAFVELFNQPIWRSNGAAGNGGGGADGAAGAGADRADRFGRDSAISSHFPLVRPRSHFIHRASRRASCIWRCMGD
jgi:hypothetical protein